MLRVETNRSMIDENKDVKDSEDKDERTTPVEPPPKVQKVVDPNLPAFRATCHR